MFIAALALPGKHAAKLKPDEDGMSLAAAFHAKLGVMHAKHVESAGKSALPPLPSPPVLSLPLTRYYC